MIWGIIHTSPPSFSHIWNNEGDVWVVSHVCMLWDITRVMYSFMYATSQKWCVIHMWHHCYITLVVSIDDNTPDITHFGIHILMIYEVQTNALMIDLIYILIYHLCKPPRLELAEFRKKWALQSFYIRLRNKLPLWEISPQSWLFTGGGAIHRPLLVCCSVLQCVAVRCSVLQCVAAFCSALQYVVVDTRRCDTSPSFNVL